MAYLNAAGTRRATGFSGSFSGAPAAGTDEVQTITIGGTPTGGTFRLTYAGRRTGLIAWSATNATLVANIDAALEALQNIGAAGVVTAVATMTAGIGTITVTFSGAALAKRALSLMVASDNQMTGTAPTVVVTETTPGVGATGRGLAPGSLLLRTDTNVAYINTGTAAAPTLTVVGAQS